MFPHQQCREFCRIESHGKNNETSLRGYCTPDQFFDCLCIFLKKLQHIGSQ